MKKNPVSMMRLLGAKKQFEENHPKMRAFFHAAFDSGVEEGTVIEIRVQKPGQKEITANIKVKPSDLELLELLSELS